MNKYDSEIDKHLSNDRWMEREVSQGHLKKERKRVTHLAGVIKYGHSAI